MTTEILVCKPDGTQTIEIAELPDNWFSIEPEENDNQ